MRQDPEKRETPRIAVFSLRGITNHMARCPQYEFEDLIAELDNADIIAPQRRDRFGLRTKLRLGLSRKTEFYNLVGPSAEPVSLEKDYDVLYIWVQDISDLLWLDAVPNWREKVRHAVCFVEELWVHHIPKLGARLKLLNQFDHIFCNFTYSLDALSQFLEREVIHMPVGIDTIRFNPYPHFPTRHIDVTNIGRRSEITHKVLYEQSEELGFYYYFDSTAAPKNAYIASQHRRFYSDLIKRSRFFISNQAKVDNLKETGGQSEVSTRCFEGLAGGAILIGEKPDNQSFDDYFGWEGSIFDIPTDCPDITNILGELDGQNDKLDKIRQVSMQQMLLRHDSLYRWQKILDTVGLPHTEAMKARLSRLHELSDIVNPKERVLTETQTG